MNNQDKSPEGLTPNLPLWSYQLQQDSKLAVKTRKDLEIHLITRALKDEGFRQELVANPKAVVEKELGVKLPEELEINVLEETEDTLYMVLPCNPYEGISEEELKASVGMSYEDVARWVLEEQRNVLLDEESSVKLMVKAYTSEVFKRELISNPIKVIEEELRENIKEILQDSEIEVFAESPNSIFIILAKVLTTSDLPIVHLSKLNMAMVLGSGTPGMGSGDPEVCNSLRGCGTNGDHPCPGFGTFCWLTWF
jgi:hypothetical protein